MQPPPNPYGAPDPYGQPNPYGADARPPIGRVNFNVISEAWTLVQPNIGQWLLGLLIVFGISFGASILANLIQLPFALSGGGPRPGAMPFSSGLGILGFLLALIIQFVVGTFTNNALFKMAIQNTRTGRAETSDMFSITGIIGKLLVVTLLTSVIFWILALPGGIAYFMGLAPTLQNPKVSPNGGLILLGMLLILPVSLVSFGLFMAPFLVMDKGMEPVEAIKTSWDTLKSQVLWLWLFFIVLGLLNVAGVIACCVGVLVTIPISIVAIALVYRDFFGGGGSAPQNPNFPNAPLADPRF